jgi:GAF domain
MGVSDEILQHLKRKHPNSFDRPSVLFNRIRERESAYWSHLLFALNNLLHRYHYRQPSVQSSAVKSGSIGSVRDEALLAGFGHRLCSYLLSIVNANVCSSYRVDYSDQNPRPVLMANHARNVELRAASKEINDFFQKMLDEDDCIQLKLRTRSRSLCVRVAAKNEAEFFSTSESGSQWIVEGYPEKHQPQSALVVPLRHNGRVLGLIEFKGLVPCQFSPQILDPLRRAANLIGPFIYQNLLLREIGAINHLLVSKPVLTWKTNGNGAVNPLKEVSQYLSNILLCPAVHIWRKSIDLEDRYELAGWSMAGIFDKTQKVQFEIPYGWEDVRTLGDLNKNKPTVLDPFAGFSVAQYMSDVIQKESNWEPTPGLFVQGFYDPSRAITDFDSYLKDVAALGLTLGRDFVERDISGVQAYRRAIFEINGLHHMMGFILLADDPDAQKRSHNARNRDHKKSPLMHVLERANAVITVHAHGDDISSHTRGWSKGWTPVIAYLQTYLSYVLSQIDRLAKRGATLGDMLHHEVRNVVSVSRRLADAVVRESEELQHGATPKLARVLQHKAYHPNTSQNPAPSHISVSRQDLWELTDRVLTTASALGRNAPRLRVVEDTFNKLVTKISQADAWTLMDELGLTGLSKRERVLYPDCVQAMELVGMNMLKAKNCHIDRTSTLNSQYNFQTYSLVFELILDNLWSNVAKYARKDSVVEVRMSEAELVIVNEGFLESGEDTKVLLLAQARSRSPVYKDVPGNGLGLAFVHMASRLCGLGFSIRTDLLGRVAGMDNVHRFTVVLRFNGQLERLR